MAADPAALPEADLALLDRLATRVVELHMEVPAILMLESTRPLSLLASQTMIFFEPIAQSLFHIPDYRRFAALIERRDAMELLTRTIEEKAERARSTPRKGRGDRAGTAPGAGPTSDPSDPAS